MLLALEVIRSNPHSLASVFLALRGLKIKLLPAISFTKAQ